MFGLFLLVCQIDRETEACLLERQGERERCVCFIDRKEMRVCLIDRERKACLFDRQGDRGVFV